MKHLITALAIALLAYCNAFAERLSGVPGRLYNSKTQTDSRQAIPAWWYQGETVTINVESTRKMEPINLMASNVTVVLDLCAATNAATVYVSQAGTITGSNTCEFVLTAESSNTVLAAGYYAGYAKAMLDEDGALKHLGVLATYAIEVKALSDSRFTDVIGPLTFSPADEISNALHAVDLDLLAQHSALSNAWKSTDTTVQWLEGWQFTFSNDWTNHTESFQRLESSSAEIGSNLTAEANARIEGDAAASSNLATEAATRLAATSLLTSNIVAEANARIEGDAAASSNLATEAATRLAATSLLTSNIVAEANARIEGDAAASSNLATEAATRLAATSLLGSNLTTEANARIEGDAAASSNLTSEASARIDADAAITGRLDVVETTALTSVSCSGGWYHPDWFTLTNKPYPYVIISEGETQAVYSVYVNSITVDSAAGYLLQPDIVRMSTFTGGVSYTALSNCSIETVSVTNYHQFDGLQVSDYDAVIFDEELATGTVATITATLNGFSRSMDLIYQASNWYSYYQYQGDVPGSLRAYINTSLAARASSTNRTMKLYADGWPTTWTRNTNCWAYGIDLTCASPYNSFGNPAEKGGTAITRQHIAFAAHYPIINGASLMFVDSTNGIHWRTQVASRQIGVTDCMIGLLDTPLPETIAPAQLMRSADNGRFLGSLNMDGGIGIRAIHLKAVDPTYPPKTFRKWACYARITSPDTEAGILGSADVAIGRTVNSPLSYGADVGDSGQPTFILIGTNVVLYSAFRSSIGGPSVGYLSPQIEDAIASMGNSVYTNLNYIYLGDWLDYNLPPPM